MSSYRRQFTSNGTSSPGVPAASYSGLVNARPVNGASQMHHYSAPPPAPAPEEIDDNDLDPTLFFEKNRIKTLQDERVHIQKKTFTKWCNSYLSRAREEIHDLFTDLADGILLLKFLEIISGEKLGRANRGRMRVQKIENLNKCLDFLKRKKIQLENIGAEDILDGNERLILGLIWTIILRFTIENIEIDGKETGERKHAKEALLLWCQRKTAGYPNVKVENFTTSWRSGLAFNALIHAHRPDLINFERLNPQDPLGNLNNAFDVAEKKLDIARLLDAEDINVAHPDEKSVITYVSLYYHYFAKQKTELTGARRVAKIVGGLLDSDQLQGDFEQISSDLLEWIQRTIAWLNDHRFPNNLKNIQDCLTQFKSYRTVEKPPKYKEKGELEALFFTIQTRRKAMRRKAYVPPQGLFMHDIESAWGGLERAEHDRQVALINEMMRLERLEQKARRFLKKAQLRENWLREMTQVLEQFECGRTAPEVEAAMKKLQAIEADILPREERFTSLSVMSAELLRENYHDAGRIQMREREVLDRWANLRRILHERKSQLATLNELKNLVRDIDTLVVELSHLEPLIRNRDIGKHILGVEDLLQKHELVEAQLNGHGEWLKTVRKQAQAYIMAKGQQYDVLQRKLDGVQVQYDGLVDLCAQRRGALSRAREYFLFVQNHEEEMNWLQEKDDICVNMLQNRHIASTPQISRLYKVLESEMQGHWQRSKQIITAGEKIMPHVASREDVQHRISVLQSRWEQLKKLSAEVGRWLIEAEKARSYFQDANDAESWIREKMPLVRSDDFGRDVNASEVLYSRHLRLEEEIHAYRQDIHRLDELAAHLAAQTQYNFEAGTSVAASSDVTTEEDLVVPQLQVLYDYTGNGISVGKDEILALIEKSNKDWWRILKQNGVEGYVPANYCRLVPGETVTVSQQTTTKTAVRSEDGKSAILERQEGISSDYRKLTNLAQTRHRFLSDAIKLYKFYTECDGFESWASETNNLLSEDAPTEHVQAFRRKFDKLENDMVTNGGTQLKRINDMADELTAEGHSQSDNIRARQNLMNQIWNDLQKLRKIKADSLRTAEILAAFEESCEDTRSWMNDKMALLQRNPDAKDIKGFEALQRRYQNLERDLKPLQEKMIKLKKLADDVKRSHPEQAQLIDRQMRELEKLHGDLLGKAKERIREAEQNQGQQMFDRAARDLIAWGTKTLAQMEADERAGDVNAAEALLKAHFDLTDAVSQKGYEFDYVDELGTRLLTKNPHLRDVSQRLAEVERLRSALKQAAAAKETRLRDQLDLQLFNREAERIDAATKGHEVFLEFESLGDSVESVENLLKRHADFESKLYAQEDRIKAFGKTTDALLGANHDQSSYIQKKYEEVVSRRRAVYAASERRRANLEAALAFQNMRRNVTELSAWISEKQKVASDDSYRETSGLHRKLLKHEAFEAELKANEAQLHAINDEGEGLIARNHYETPAIRHTLATLNADWERLVRSVREKGAKLSQADAMKQLNRTLGDAHQKLDELETQLASTDFGSDLRSVKDAIQKHNLLEQEIVNYERKIHEVAQQGQKMIADGHFDASEIQQSINAFVTRFNDLQEPSLARRHALEESRKWHQLAFDVDLELQWIAEKRVIADSEEVGRSLTQSLSLLRKLEQLEAEVAAREPYIQTALKNGDLLAESGHSAKKQIAEKCRNLSTAWAGLNAAMGRRRVALDYGHRKEQYFFDVAEVESWLLEKSQWLDSVKHEDDEVIAQKLLAKLKALQNDMLIYKEQLATLAKTSQELQKTKPSEADLFASRQQKVEGMLAALENAVASKRLDLDAVARLCAYVRESQELEAWINEQLTIAMSEDYGTDYEHLKDLEASFEEFKQAVRTGSERFVLCEESASELLKLGGSTPFARDVLDRQEKLRSVWTLLLDYIESREAKLGAASELHKFNRDVAEMMERIEEKRASIPEEVGKDLKQVHKLWLKHEVFENELIAMEGQLKVLLEESAKLTEQYPGGNAEHIAQQQAALSEAWHGLQEAAIQRRDRLQAAYDLHKFMGSSRDLIDWTNMAITEMQSEQPIRDLQGAEWLRKEHSHRVKAEIDAREPELRKLDVVGRQMVEKEHYAAHDIERRLQQLNEAFVAVNHEWNLKDQWLYQVVQWHAFEREARQILSVIAVRESTLASTTVGGTVDDVAMQQRKFETFRNTVGALEERIASLDSNARKLVERKHMESEQITRWNQNVKEALVGLQKKMETHRLRLEDALRLAQFNSDVAEMGGWIDEKYRKLVADTERQGQVISLEDKMKLLQKHQAFEAEMSANEPRIAQIKRQTSELRRLPEMNSFTLQKAEDLGAQWERLVALSRDQSGALEEARDMLAFKQLEERVYAWIREKELMLSVADMGRDLEHCQELLDRLVGARADASVNDHTLASLNELGAKLIKQGRSSRDEVQQQLTELNQAWSILQGRLGEYRTNLEAAKEVHIFNRDVDDTNDRIHEKANLLGSDDFGKDLAAVETLVRKQDAIERDMTAIHTRLNTHDNDAQELLRKNPPLRHTIIDSLRKLEDSWQHLANLAHGRRVRLEQSHHLHKYYDAIKKSEAWAKAVETKMTTYPHPDSVADAQALIDAHQEKLAEIDGRQDEIRELREFGQRIATEQPEHKADIQRSQRRIQKIEHEIRQTWERQNLYLRKALEVQRFYDHATLADNWLAAKEAFIAQGDCGESLESVDELLEKHLNFEKTLRAQSTKIEALKEDAKAIVERDSENRERVETRLEEVELRYSTLLYAVAQRELKLKDARKLHDFIRRCGELITWMNAKLQLAYDESYIDPTNLRSKLQKHLAFDAELEASEGRLDAIKEEGEALLRSNLDDKESVHAQLQEVVNGWEELKKKSALKSKALREAYEAHQLNRKLEDLDKWLDRVEQDLSTDDHGKDLISVENLLKKHDALEGEIAARSDVIDETVNKVVLLKEQNYSNVGMLATTAEELKTRYEGLKEPCEIRRENLEEARRLFEWQSEANEQMGWLNEKMPQIESTDYGSTLLQAQSLHKRHQILEQEIHSHESVIAHVRENGLEMVTSGHFAGAEIQKKINAMGEQLLEISQMCRDRATKIQESIQAHAFFNDVTEAHQWVRERLPLATNQDTGKDQAAAESHLRRLTALEKEVVKFSEEVKTLRTKSDEMVAESNFHATVILSRQSQLEEQFEQLQKECARRRAHLRDAVKYHGFVRQADDLGAWLREKNRVAAEDDNGRDLEDCQRIADEFDQVLRELSAAGERVASVQRQSEELLRSGHSLSASIRAKATDLHDLWKEVNDAANERQQALVGAKMVHKFDQDADEMLHWLGEKEALQVAMDSEDFSSTDLADVQRLIQKHEEFAHGLVAVERQVADLCREAEKLEQIYPATQAHLDVRRQDMEMQLNDVLSASELHRKRLEQTQLLQAYFAEHRALIAWIRHMQTVITSEVLPRDVSGCEALDARHAEYKTEINARVAQKNDFAQKGHEMIRGGNMLSSEIQTKIASLDAAFKALNDVWEMRRRIYEENANAQLWKQEAALLERWLTDRENMLMEDWKTIDCVDTAEDHLRNFDDFLVTLEAQNDKFEALKRLTLIEKSFAEIRERESQILSLSISQPESRRETQTIKTLEKKKLLQEKRQDRERRKTQEISLLKPSPSLGDADLIQRDYMSLPRPRTTSGGSDSASKVTVTATPATVVPGPSTERRLSGGCDVSTLHYVPDLPASTAATPTPTFTTRRSHSLNKPRSTVQDHSSIDMFGFVERKQVLQSGGKKATIRAWKKNYTILCGQLLCFFKDEAAFLSNAASSPPIYILGARCEQAIDYSRRKNVFRLLPPDGAEYLFECSTETEMVEWINKIQFHANLSPANQLQSFRSPPEDGAPTHTPPPKPEVTPRRFTADSPKTFGFIGSLKRKS
ncbi:hypothetical protein QR680_005192 [Steinernema hermaphroditum]|uniref:Spectrin beta chain n=1 Tax=Steinernema hermaphroditum TaxID=289476 RepID=A0AA39LV80_9BILA|nr:hypothetical protein QR680_005192 [Steinernema hermaphroditum]